MLPQEVFKRRHFGTPESFFLITLNYIVLALATELFALCKINWFFWVVIGVLAFYNFYLVRREREDYDRVRIIAYVISLAGLVLMFFLFRSTERCH